MLALIQNNFVAVAITAFLILFILTNNNFEKRTNRLFLAASLCILVLIVEEAWEAELAMQATYAPLRVPLSALGYILRPAVPYLLTLIFKRFNQKGMLLLSIPLAANTLVALSSLFCKLSFWYTPDNRFVRGPLGLTPFFTAAFYVIILLILTNREYKNGGSTEAMIVSAIVLLAFLSTVLESMFRIQFIQNPSMATSVTFYYLFLHSNVNNRDPLTGARTRRRFYLDADKYHSALSAVISLDVNDLKQLNDQYGHMEGDKALIEVTSILKNYMGTRASLYRTGGDEFMILCYKLDEKSVQALVNRIRADMEKTKYRCAIGYSPFSSQMQFDRACQTADSNMYEDKKKMKAKQMEQKG